MNLSPEGAITVTLTRQGASSLQVAIDSTRPQLAQRLLQGRTPAEAARVVGLVFSLCGRAQRVACEAACEAAVNVAHEANPPSAPGREAEVLREMAREHAWRLLVNWPQQAGLPGDMASLALLNQAGADTFADVLDRILRDVLLGTAADIWLARDLAGIEAWAGAGSTMTAGLFALQEEKTGVNCPLLPGIQEFDAAAVQLFARQVLGDPGFCARPHWQDQPAETGALARRRNTPLLAAWLEKYGRGAAARMLARLQELAEIPARLRGAPRGDLVQGWHLPPDLGLAGVETSRGLLLHGVRLKEGLIADYRILAPTEWNFHPAGPLQQALSGLSGAGDLAARARELALSLDPCVDYRVDVRDQLSGNSHA